MALGSYGNFYHVSYLFVLEMSDLRRACGASHCARPASLAQGRIDLRFHNAGRRFLELRRVEWAHLHATAAAAAQKGIHHRRHAGGVYVTPSEHLRSVRTRSFRLCNSLIQRFGIVGQAGQKNPVRWQSPPVEVSYALPRNIHLRWSKL